MPIKNIPIGAKIWNKPTRIGIQNGAVISRKTIAANSIMKSHLLKIID
tara:strand:- start:62 stop:205 length:144 start_codon:yes stop_codon:yes gene_type:complete